MHILHATHCNQRMNIVRRSSTKKLAELSRMAPLTSCRVWSAIRCICPFPRAIVVPQRRRRRIVNRSNLAKKSKVQYCCYCTGTCVCVRVCNCDVFPQKSCKLSIHTYEQITVICVLLLCCSAIWSVYRSHLLSRPAYASCCLCACCCCCCWVSPFFTSYFLLHIYACLSFYYFITIISVNIC